MGADVTHLLGRWCRYKYVAASALLNLFIIVVYGLVYEALAEALTNWENHRTQTQVQYMFRTHPP